MRIRLTKKLAERVDGIDVSRHRVGDILNLPPKKARLLIAEHWATAEERRRTQGRTPRPERRRRTSPPLEPDPEDGLKES
jgi:hypothetical protein